MVKQFFTFLTHHTHPETGESMATKYITIVGPDKQQCRQAMFKKYGDKFDSQYNEEPAPPRFPAYMRCYEIITLVPNNVKVQETDTETKFII